MEERVQRIIAHSGLCSKRKAEALIADGKVTVNGRTIKLGDKADPASDKILVEGRPLASERKRYVMLNKPRGYTSTVEDPHAERIVTELVQGRERLYPVGRLDVDSEGLILLTNDGSFAYRVTHPKFEIGKTYHVKADRDVSAADCARISEGIMIEGRKTSPAAARKMEGNKIEITIHEGRKRIIRKMLAFLGYKVLALKRVAIGGLALGDLPVGKSRDLTESEIEKVFSSQPR